MSEVSSGPARGCLICLVQASGPMREVAFSGRVATKVAAATLVVDRVLNELARFAVTSRQGPSCFEVGVFAYSTRSDGKSRLRPVLPGSSSDRPVLSFHELFALIPHSDVDTNVNFVKINPSGAAPARAALRYTRALLARWAAEHPGAIPPVVIHFTDGETTDGPIGVEVGALMDDPPGATVVHCLFRPGAASSALLPFPETPCGDYWAMSSAYTSDDMADLKAPLNRFLFVNKLSASRTISKFVRRLWSSGAVPCDIEPPEPTIDEAASEQSGEPECAVDNAPARSPRFEMRALWMPKRGNSESEWEDGYAENSSEGVLAVADGAGDGIFTKLWVDLLLSSFTINPIVLDDISVTEPWIQERRREWFQAIRYPEQRWSIQRKVDQSCAAATFLAFRLDPSITLGEAPPNAVCWTAWAVGDICLFHIREGRLIASFPIGASADFNLTPLLYQSKAMRPLPDVTVCRGELRQGDLIIFATDATAQRLLAEVESNNPPDWERYWNIDQEHWRQEIDALRDRNAIVNDDCTLVVLGLPRLSDETPHENGALPVDERPTSPTSPRSETATQLIDTGTESGERGSSQPPTLEPEAAVPSAVDFQRDETDSESAPTEPHLISGEQS